MWILRSPEAPQAPDPSQEEESPTITETDMTGTIDSGQEETEIEDTEIDMETEREDQ